MLNTTLNCKGKLLDLSKPKVMGILNLTPDSFYDGGRYFANTNDALRQTEQMLSAGAAMIDIGGMSSRPGAKLISVEEELQRVLPTIESIHKKFPQAILSIDTVRSEVARQAVAAGASIINDISAGNFDEKLLETVADLQVPYILMHLKGKPETMQDEPIYENIVQEMVAFFQEKLTKINTLGIRDVVIDMGFGFGKTLEHNYEILRQLQDFQLFDLPILVGISRKSMIYKHLNVKPVDALNGTTALHTFALLKGCQILRVHDVKEAVEVVKLVEML
ncbi:MAG: dihydropteroate synthase [Chitinophagales bacterium]